MNGNNGWLSRIFQRERAPEPVEKKMAGTAVSSGFVALHNSLNADWTAPSYGALAQAGFMKNPIVHRCVRLISEGVGTLPFILYDGETEVTDHQVIDLLDRPNMHQSKRNFFEAVCGHLLLSGNAYIEQRSLGDTQLPSQIYAIRPDRISCTYDEHGWPIQYRVSGATQRVINLEPDDEVAKLLHVSLFHPLDDQSGFAPLNAALMALDTHNAAASWNKALLDNAARPSGALVYAPSDGSNLSPDQFDNLKRELEEGYGGAMNAGKPMLLDGGLDWKSMGLSPKDMDFIEMKNGASRDIALAFGVPPMLLGIPGDNTYANYQEANRAFFRLTVMPMMSRIVEALNNWLSPALGSKHRLKLDLDKVDGLSYEREALWSRLQNATFLTDDEKRLAIGYSPLEEDG